MNQPLVRSRTILLLLLFLLVAVLGVAPGQAQEEEDNRVRVETPLGDFEIELFPEDAPNTVANFLAYIEDGRFQDSFIHRSVPGFVLQGGGFVYRNGTTSPVSTFGTINNEFKRSNVRGTLAMAKAEGDPNSATSQWFINLADNSGNLDSQNGGFTVFGQVVGDGMDIVDALAAVPVFNLGGNFPEVPLRNYLSGPATENNLLFTNFYVGPPVAPSLLLRNIDNGKWYTYRLGPDGNVVTIDEKGGVKLPRSRDLVTVSRGDFNADREPDILLRDPEANDWRIATLNGKRITDQESLALPSPGDYEVVASADFNGDLRGDILLRDSSTGRWQIWLFSGTGVRAGGEVAITDDLDQVFAGVADVDGDGDFDVLIRKPNGKWVAYVVDGPGTPTSTNPRLPGRNSTELVALADFDGSGSTDALMRSANGKWQVYFFTDGQIRGKGTVSMPRNDDVQFVGTADFNGDDRADVLLRAADGTWHLYLLDGRRVIASFMPGMTIDTDYELVWLQDQNGDGMADILLRNDSGDWLLYTIDGTIPEVTSSSSPKLNSKPAWVPQFD
jgi:cyclophilin family peptidyl-prolyl cis-trans isomerase